VALITHLFSACAIAHLCPACHALLHQRGLPDVTRLVCTCTYLPPLSINHLMGSFLLPLVTYDPMPLILPERHCSVCQCEGAAYTRLSLVLASRLWWFYRRAKRAALERDILREVCECRAPCALT
jgi:hypothetical protein